MGTKMYLPSTDLVKITVSPWSGCSWFLHTTWRLLLQNGDLNIYHHENVKSHRLRLLVSPNKNSGLIAFALCGLVATHVIIFCICCQYDEPWPHYSTTL